MDEAVVVMLEARFPYQNVRHLASLPKTVTIREGGIEREETLTLQDELDAAHTIYGTRMKHNGGNVTDERLIESILTARARFISMGDQELSAMRNQEIEKDRSAGRS